MLDLSYMSVAAYTFTQAAVAQKVTSLKNAGIRMFDVIDDRSSALLFVVKLCTHFIWITQQNSQNHVSGSMITAHLSSHQRDTGQQGSAALENLHSALYSWAEANP